MLVAALSFVLLAQDEPPRLRTLCPNGAAVIVENLPNEPLISVQLWASARSTPETKATHGFRHLLEHLVARGPVGLTDQRLESAGCTLRARTFRDAMQIEINVGPRQLDLALKTISSLLRPINPTQEQIDREIGVMKEEFATYEDSARLSAGAWSQAYGDAGLDPFGTIDSLSKATPDALKKLQNRHFYPENLVLSIAGPINIKQATLQASEIVGVRQGGIRSAPEPTKPGVPGRIEVEGFGEGRAAIVGSYDRPTTMGALAAALSVGSDVEGTFVTYTPSDVRGMVIVGQTEKVAGIGLKFDGLQESELSFHFLRGKMMAKSWVSGQLRSAQGVAYLRGFLLCQSHGNRPEAMLTAIDNLTFPQFKESLGMFAKDKAVTMVGR